MTAADEPTVPDEAVFAALESLAAHQYDVEDSVPWMRRALAAAAPSIVADAVADAEREFAAIAQLAGDMKDERDEARRAIAAERERIAAALVAEANQVYSVRPTKSRDENNGYYDGLMFAARSVRAGGQS